MENYRLFIRSMKVMGKRCYLYLGSIFVMSTALAMFGILSSLLMKCVVDIAQTKAYQTLPQMIFIIVIAGAVSLLVYRAAAIHYNVEAKRVYGILSEAVLETEMALPYSYYEKHHSGELVAKVSYDLTKMGDIYGSRFRRVVMPFLQVIAYLIPMLWLSWQLTLCLVAANALMMGIELLLLEPMHRVSRELSGVNTVMTSRLSDLLQGMEQVRMYEGGPKTIQEFKEQNHLYAKKSGKRILYTACLECSGQGFELLCSLVFLLIGVIFVNRGYTTLGALTAIYTMYGSFSYQFLQMGKYIPELVACLANAQNIFDFLDETREPANWNTQNTNMMPQTNRTKESEAQKTMIAAQNISFSYTGEESVIKDFSIKVGQGECIAITGASGCGKTTFSKLLLGLYPLSSGTMQINGLDMTKCSLSELRRQIAYVPQEPYLFQGTIMDNIRMGNPQVDEEEIIQAAKLANAHDFISEFADGYQTKVGERGNNLSGGQRQRIAIARAVLKNAPILLMDEATSALDNESEQLVNEALKNLHGKNTIIMIAHRPSTIQLADRVCRMEGV